MALLRNGFDLAPRLSTFVSTSDNLFIFAAYVKLESLKHILDSTRSCKLLVVRWELKDLLLGASDLEVFGYCQEKGITLYRNPRLHLKAFVNDYKSCILGSANISSRGINLPPSNRPNYELASVCENLTFEDRLYFQLILNDSTLVTDALYLRLKDRLANEVIELPGLDEANFEEDCQHKNFLISSLPMTANVATLMRIYSNQNETDETELNCVIHDLALYDLPLGLAPLVAKERLTDAFFRHPFIEAFLKNVQDNGMIYFGRAKEWIRANCTDVPTPRRWEVTGNTRILYDWLVELGNGRIEVDIPGARSERLRII
jgi:phosphatidylserine/phosphatidylglycerophosphate/cardiolipin synthase-like enzyme